MIDPRLQNRAARRRARAQAPSKPGPLAALTTAALSIPGMAGADSPPEDITTAYAFSYYKEDDISASKVSTGSTERYEIFAHQFSVDVPVGERWDLGTDLVYETMSGATPWYVQPGQNGGAPQQAMTQATVSDQRFDGNLRGSFYFDEARVGGNFGGSTENDYWAIYGGVNGERHINDKNTTLLGSLAFSADTIEPTNRGCQSSIVKENKQSFGLVAGFAQIIGRKTNLQSTLNYKYGTGFLSDPYKEAWIESLGGSRVCDTRPGQRNQVSWLTRLRHHFEGINASAHVDYQFYWDDWDITSHTVKLAWYQNLFGDVLQIIPSFRYYSQGQAFFYAPVYPVLRPDGLASSDYRLSPFGAIKAGVRLQTRIEDWPGDLDWRLAISYDRYMSDVGWALGKVRVANPGLVDYNHIYATLGVAF